MIKGTYFLDERHSWLNSGLKDWSVPNIGFDGGDLTICFLSMNRSSLSLRLLRSIRQHIPNFGGRILIADNGSEQSELEILRRFAAEHPQMNIEILEFGQNYGVAGGRNRAFAEIKTDWILSLDNDIFLTGNPLARIQDDIAVLGCKFISVPLVNPDLQTFYSFGGQLTPHMLEDGTPFLGTNCMLPPNSPLSEAASVSPDGRGFLCTFLFGGASVLNRDAFWAMNGFDDGMFVGFEDIEFSLRLFRAGQKVASSTTPFFVHDHPPAEISADRNYEKTRYSRMILKNSAEHFERKHGFRVWSAGVDEWLEQREATQGFASAPSAPGDAPVGEPAKVKPRIALVVDADNWAYANIANQLEKHLGGDFAITTYSTTRLNEIEAARAKQRGDGTPFSVDGPHSFVQLLLLTGYYDIVHVFWRPVLTVLGPNSFYGDLIGPYADFLNLTPAEFRRRFVDPACFTTSVYDHLFASGDDLERMKPALNAYAADYTVSSGRLENIYRALPGVKEPAATIPDGVDPELFFPKRLERFDDIAGRELVVGWVGNSLWGKETDSKGVHTILKPAIEQLRAAGHAIRLHMADRSVAFTPQHEMVDFYAQIDVLACTSEIEGTPNPVLEAMACGVAVVSTDVGIVRDALGPKQSQFILKERSVEALKAALLALLGDPGLPGELSAENLESIRAWTWARQAEKFGAFFRGVIDRTRGNLRTKICTLPFTTPSQEPDGSIRLCSAASTLRVPREQTNMGNARDHGLNAVWTGEKYRRVREGLLAGGERLTPYCADCEYRHDGPAWLLQLHLALHAYHNGARDADLARLLASRIDRHDEYLRLAPGLGIAPYPAPEGVAAASPAVVAFPETLVSAADLPIFIDLNTLNRCNVSCIMCPPAIKYEQGGQRDEYYRLSVDEYLRLAEGMNVKSVHFVGAYAEPLLNKEIFDLVTLANRQGAFTAITTNAQPLTSEFSQKLIDAGLDMMSISLHGATAATAETIMRKSSFVRTIDNIENLQRLKRERGVHKPDIYFNFVSQLGNIGELPEFIALAGRLKVQHVQVIHLIDGDEVVDATTNLTRHPELLAEKLIAAKEVGERLNVNVIISPAYNEILEAYLARQREDALTS